MGNKIAATKTRSGVKEDNGQFTYGYDALNQLISVSKDISFGQSRIFMKYSGKNLTNLFQYLSTDDIYDIAGKMAGKGMLDFSGFISNVIFDILYDNTLGRKIKGCTD